jgi:pyruvate formate lyase activating enzyme
MLVAGEWNVNDNLKEAAFWEKRDGKIACLLCPQKCVLGEGDEGVCMGRQVIEGKLFATNYGEVVSLAIDPIEKKPLYHFFPGKIILSIGPNGCNFRCSFCQNCDISQSKIPTRFYPPDQLVELAGRSDSVGIAYTYSEPLIWYEYLMDVAPAVADRGLVNVLVTNGNIEEEPLRRLLPFVHALNIDIKSMDETFYRKVCKSHLEPTLRTAEISKQSCHVEITNLLIPGLNTGEDQITRLVDWVAEHLGRDTPLHFSRYFPHHKMDVPPTAAHDLELAHRIGASRLDYVYLGNVMSEEGGRTTCPSCGNVLVNRNGYRISTGGLNRDVCRSCGRKADFVLNR